LATRSAKALVTETIYKSFPRRASSAEPDGLSFGRSSTPLMFKTAPHALNVSVSTTEGLEETVGKLAPKLLALRERIQHEFDVASNEW